VKWKHETDCEVCAASGETDVVANVHEIVCESDLIRAMQVDVLKPELERHQLSIRPKEKFLVIASVQPNGRALWVGIERQHVPGGRSRRDGRKALADIGLQVD
jgi:hypothetical protein